MNVYIMVDLEGISGLYCREQMTPDQRRFDEARRFMTREINICAEACKREGVEKVIVRDGHGGSYTVLWDQLSPAVDEVVCGITGDVRYMGLEECDAVILLGYHAMAGTPSALLEHTMSSATVQNYWLNGVRIGEVALDAAILTDRKKPSSWFRVTMPFAARRVSSFPVSSPQRSRKALPALAQDFCLPILQGRGSRKRSRKQLPLITAENTIFIPSPPP